jgi:murein DD-endopeptidase MepM/ murein hydrolase activator NlpD
MGDTIPGIANKNSLSVNELLTANPTLYYNEKENEQSLLAPGDIVITDLVLDPVDSLIKVVVEKHRVAEEVIPYSTDWVPVDYLTVGYNTEVQTGKNGAVKKTYKVQEINGKIDDTIEIASSVLLEPIPRVIHTGNTYNPLIGNPQIWRWPAAGYVVTSSYGYRWGKLHAAIDIAGSYYGSPIYAANNGYIEDIYYDRWGGWQVRINHGLGFKTVYAHLSSNPAKFVAEGQIVKPGTIIGGMGATGNVTGMHLHFEIWYNGVRINPSRWALNQRGWDYTFR